MSATVHYDGASVGTVDDEDVLCGHGTGFNVPQDPDLRFLRSCEQAGVFYVPQPDDDEPVALCGWHLARYLDAFPEQAAKLQAGWGVNDFAAHPAVTALEDKQAPATYESNGRQWRRLALDQAGRVHYISDDLGQPAMLELEPDLETTHPTPLNGSGLAGYLDDIRKRRGWAELDQDGALALHLTAGGEGGGG